MRRVVAASAVLTLAGTAHAFIVSQFAIGPGGSITPSSGLFVAPIEEVVLGNGSVVTDTSATWRHYSSYIFSGTWLGADPAGGGPDIDGFTNSFTRFVVGPGPGGDPTVPQWSGSAANFLAGWSQQHGIDYGIRADGTAILGGSAGISWGAGPQDSFNAYSMVSPVNGVSVDSIFFGYFVLADPNATLLGDDLIMTINDGDWTGHNVFLALDGTPSPEGYAIRYEAHVSPWGDRVLKGFVVLVPGPGVGGVGAMGALALMRRRRWS